MDMKEKLIKERVELWYYSAPLNEVLGEPTHWMPLPQPLEIKEEKKWISHY